jgi:uncharacterized RDD family membrane protein YckC
MAMIGDAAAKSAAHAARAGFWARFLAFGADALIVNVLITAIGLSAMGLTGGMVRLANAVVNTVDCSRSEPPPPGLALPDGFDVADARRCTHAVLGIVYDRTLVVRDRIAAGADEGDSDGSQVSIPLDAAGHPVSVLYLDGLIPLVLAAWLLLLEWRFGTTPGKHIFGIMVRSLGGGPMDLVQAGKRLLPRLIVFALASVVQILPGSSTGTHWINFGITLNGNLDLGNWTGALNLVALCYVVSFAVATSLRMPPPHDWWAGTEAVRDIT